MHATKTSKARKSCTEHLELVSGMMGDFSLVFELQEGIDLERTKFTFTHWDLDLLGCWRITVPGECCAADVLPSRPSIGNMPRNSVFRVRKKATAKK